MLAHIEIEAKSDFADYTALLRRFGINANHFDRLSKDHQQRIQKVFEEMQSLVNELPNVSSYALMNWAEVLLAEQELDLEMILSSKNIFLNRGSEKTETILASIYLGLNLINLAFSLASLVNVNPGNTLSTLFGSGWNYIDAIGFIGIARQFQLDEWGLGMANLTGNLQSVACTILANLAQYTTLIHASSATITGLLGFSCAAGMLVSLCVELGEIQKCNNRIKTLEKKLQSLSDEDDHYQTIQKAIFVEKAQRENHIRSAKSWAACTIVMMAIAIVSYVALSGLTFGALPAVTVLLAAAAFATGIIRKWWVGKENHVQHVKTALKKTPEGNPSLLARLNKVIKDNDYEIDFNEKIDLHDSRLFKTKLSFKEYLEDLIIRDPKKLANILTQLEGNRLNELYDAVSQHRNSTVVGGFGKTRGYKIIQALGIGSINRLVMF